MLCEENLVFAFLRHLLRMDVGLGGLSSLSLSCELVEDRSHSALDSSGEASALNLEDAGQC